MYKAIIFDFDGVILNSEPLHFQACVDALKDHDISLDYAEYKTEYIGLADKEMFPQLLMSRGQFFNPKEISLLIDKKIEHYANLINSRNKLPFIAGIEDFILKSSKVVDTMGICTGSSKTELIPILERFKYGHLNQFITSIVTSEDVEYGKPSPEGYLLTLKNLNVEPEQCIAFEDSSYGIEAAKKAGLYVVGVASTCLRHELTNADEVIDSFENLEPINFKLGNFPEVFLDKI